MGMQEVKGGEFGAKWNVKAEEFRSGAPSNYREGYYVGSNTISMPGKNPFRVYSFQPVEKDGKFGELFSLAQDKVLGDKLENVPLKTFTGLEYMGKKPNKDKSKQPFHDWKVMVDPEQITYEAAQAKNISLGGSASPVSVSAQAIGANTEINPDDLPF
jgi:hypothetical protein